MISRRSNYQFNNKTRPKAKATAVGKAREQKKEQPPPKLTVTAVVNRLSLNRFLMEAFAVLAHEKSNHASSLIFLTEALGERVSFGTSFQIHGLEERRMKSETTVYACIRLSLTQGGNRQLIEEVVPVAPWWKHTPVEEPTA